MRAFLKALYFLSKLYDHVDKEDHEMQSLDNRLLLRPNEAAAMLGISRSKIYELLGKKAIPSIRIDGSIRIPAIQLRAWIDSQVEEPR